MKKKISAILTTIFVLMACVFASACGDKYSKLQFEVMYAFTSDAEEWFDASDGISANFGEGGELTMVNGRSEIFIKVDIKNVKKKHVGRITVSKSQVTTTGIDFANINVKENEVFSVGITGIANTTLVFYENNSGKSTSVDLTVSKSLEDLVLNPDIVPALSLRTDSPTEPVMMRLDNLNNILYYPLNETNELGVEYSLLSLGYYSNGEYKPTIDSAGLAPYITLVKESNELTVKIKVKVDDNSFFSDTAYVLRVAAQSLYREDKKVEFDIYFVEGTEPAPVVRYYDEEKGAQIEDPIRLYLNSPEGSPYTSSYVYIDAEGENGLGELGSIYKNGAEIAENEIIKYQPVIYVDGEKYDFDSAIGMNGLVISDKGNSLYQISALDRLKYKNTISFAYELEGIEVTRTVPVQKTNIEVIKSVLPSGIMIDGSTYSNGSVINSTIYDYDGAEGKLITLSAVPTAYDPNNLLTEKEIIIIKKDEDNLKLTNAKGGTLDDYVGNTDYYAINSGDSILVKCVAGEDVNLVIKTKCIPSEYNGETLIPDITKDFVSVSIKFARKVTADSVEFFDSAECVDKLDHNSIFRILQGEEDGYTNLYIKAYSDGVIAGETLVLSSENNSIKFIDNNGTELTTIGLDKVSSAKYDDYTLYTIKIKETLEGVRDVITLTVGDREFGPIVVESVHTLNVDELSVEIDTNIANAIKVSSDKIDNNHQNFAIARNEKIGLKIQENNGIAKGISKINLSTISKSNNYNSDYFNDNISFPDGREIENGNVFSVQSVSDKTCIVNLKITYWYIENNEIKSGEKDIVLEFAVYNPIARIELTLGADEIAYVNSLYDSSLNVEFEAKANRDQATNKIYFSKKDNVDEAEIIADIYKLSFMLDTEHSGVNFDYGTFDARYNVGGSSTSLTNDELTALHGKGEIEIGAHLHGNLILSLKKISTLDNFKIRFMASLLDGQQKSFGEESVTIKTVNKSDNISFSGIDLKDGEIVSDQIAEYELRMTYMDKDTKQDSKEFDATIHFGTGEGLSYNDLVYSLHEIDEIGNIDYSEDVTNSNIIINENNGHFVITAKNVGGRYLLVVKAKDSYNGSEFDVKKSIAIRIDDGSEQYKYLVTSPTEFNYIEKDLTAYYELGANIELGVITKVFGYSATSTATAFTGGIDGNGYTLTYEIGSQYAQISEGNVISLFAILGSGEGANKKTAKISDLNINVTIKVANDSATGKDLIVAGFAGLAQSAEIDNVGLLINKDSSVVASVSTNDNIYFGGLIGINRSTITNSSVEYESETTIDIDAKENAYIGAMVAVNEGSIVGIYDGKDDLDTIAPDIRTWLNIPCAELNYLIGGVAGDNAGTISKMMISGKIATAKDESITPKGFLGGVAGNASGDISTIAVLALDLESNCLNVAGAAGSAENIKLDNVKVINVEFEYALYTYFTGKIEGHDIVAGLVADGNNTTITNSSVENFIQEANYYTLIGAKVYGLMYGKDNTGSVSNSFVSANLKTSDTLDITTNATETNTYFVGSVDSATVSNTTDTYAVIGGELYYNGDNTLALSMSPTSETLSTIMAEVDKTKSPSKYEYIYIFENGKYKLVNVEEFDNKIYYTLDNYHNMIDLYIKINGTDYLPLNTNKELDQNLEIYTLLLSTDKWSTSWSTIVKDNENNDFKISSKLNCITVDGKNIYLPYLVDGEGNPLLIIAPMDIDAKINQDEINDIHSVYVDEYENDKDIEGVTIDEMAIINYYDNAKDEDNTYNLRDLIDLTIFPALAQGGIRFEIIGAVTLPARINGDFISFYGITGNNPIIVRCYSLFSPDLEKFVAFYSDYGVSELQINSSDRVYEVQGDDINYAMTLYTGDKAQLLSIDAKNILDGNEYKTIFDSFDIINKDELFLEVTDSNKLDITKSGFDIELGISSTDFSDGYEEIVTISLMLKKDYYDYIPEDSDDIEIASIKLKVILKKSATDIVVGSDYYDMYTSGNLNVSANLYTGFISDSPLVNKIEDITLVDNQYTFVQTDRDSIILGISQVGGDNTAFDTMLANIKEYHNETITKDTVINLFNVEIRTTDITLPTTDITVGYRYDISIELKNEFYYRYISEDIQFEMAIIAYTDPNINKTVSFTLKPSKLGTKRIENYNVKTFDPFSQYQNIVTNEYVESSTIEPGGIGSVMMLYLEPEYANVQDISITSESKPIASLGGANVYLKYTQYIYDHDQRAYVSYFGEDKNYQDGTTLKLNKASERKNGQIIYTGVIYIHVMLDRFSGVESFESTIDLTLGDGSTTDVEKTLITSYIPTVTTKFDGNRLNDTNGYMIQEGTANTLDLKIYGYQFNNNPNINLGWYLPDGSNYWYSDATIIESEEDFNKTSEKWYQYNGKYYRANQDAVYEANKYYKVDKYNAIYPLSDTTDVRYIGNFVHTYLKNDYKEIKHDLTDDSYTMGVGFNVAKNIPAAFSIGGSLHLMTKDGQLRTSESESLIFYPADYILADSNPIALLDSPNTIAIGANKEFALGFKTIADPAWNVDIFNRLVSEYTADKLLEEFKFVNNNAVLDFTNEDYIDMIYNDAMKKYIIRGIAPLEADVKLILTAHYILNNDGTVRLAFKLAPDEKSNEDIPIELTFALNVYAATSEEEPLPIYSASDMFNSDGSSALAESAHYILMADIDLNTIADGIMPISTKIASLDGNNKIIKMGKIKTDETTNYGLFSEIGSYPVKDKDGNTTSDNGKTTLKNIIVDYSAFSGLSVTGLENQNIFFGGLVGKNNDGLIYNCDVVNTDISKKVVVTITAKKGQNITLGGLVGQNNGIITNSRVGRESYEKIEPTIAGLGRTVSFGTLEFAIGDSENNAFNALVGGFAGENTRDIVSSFVARTNVVNYSMAEDSVQNDNTTSGTNKTAGFVAKNSGDISFSYVRGTNSTGTYYKGSKIQHLGNGAVAGFVHENSGNVDNSFANITLASSSAPLAGFVYNNAESGTISKSYSACEFNDGNDATAFEQPFVGKTSKDIILSDGELINTYYYILDNQSTDIDNPENKPMATGLNKSNFETSTSLIGFDFVLSNTIAERNQGIWSYYTANGERRSLPELVIANNIAHSCRYLSGETIGDDGIKVHTYSYVTEFRAGNKNNPYIIRDVDDYTNVFINEASVDKATGNKVFTGYVRFINDIAFNETNAVPTRSNYILGSNTAITSIEGNGVTISGILIEADSANDTNKSLGLFSEIDNVYLKNLNLKFAYKSEITSSTNILYTGGLAGKINDSVIISVSLEGNNVSLAGHNFVGGLAGKITGRSIVYSIDSNLNVSVGKRESTAIYGDPNYSYLDTEYSYGGGLAGVIDLDARPGQASDSFNLAYITIHGDQMANKANGNILADFAGGIAGYANEKVSALKLKYYNGASDQIIGNRAVGGLFGVFAGSMTASQVTMIEGESLEEKENNQYKIDTAFAKYILDIEKDTSTTLDTTKIGNVSLLQSYGYAGGLVGFSINAKITSSYSKASISNGTHIGGLVGADIASVITYSYAVPFINESKDMAYIGGLIGYSYANKETNNKDIKTYQDMAKKIMSGATDIRSKLEFTFSTLMMENNSQFENSGIKIDYIANYDSFTDLDGNAIYKPTFNRYVFFGNVNNYRYKVKGSDEEKKISSTLGKDTVLKVLLALENSDDQATAFQGIFSGWSSISYWSLDRIRYYPLLLNETVLNYTIIENENDLLKITADGHYKIIKDIKLSSYTRNWVIGHIDEFRGTLTGEKGNKEVPIIYGMELVDTEDSSTGFFQSTRGATISNLKFVWGTSGEPQAINTNSKNITYMSGLTCKDEGSIFTNVQVSVASDLLSGGTMQSGTMQSFGGLIGDATNSNIIDCSFSGSVKATLKDHDGVDTQNDDSYFGGLIAKAQHIQQISDGEGGFVDVESGQYEDAMSITGSYVGEDSDFKIHPTENTSSPKTNFDITISEYTKSYIGGLIGRTDGGAMSEINVGNDSYHSDYKNININLDYSNVNADTQYFGGIAGYASGTTISSTSTSTISNITLGNGNYNIGGIAGEYTLDSDIPDTNGIRRSVSGSDMTISSADSKTATSVNIGGLIGIGNTIAIKQSLADGAIDMSSANVLSTYAGGLIGSVVTKSDIRESMSNMDMIVSSETTMYAGGLVGQNNGNTAITHAVSAGRIVPIVSGEGSIDLAVGGLVGKTKDLKVENSYSTSSIVADSLSSSAVKAMYSGTLSNINALIGNHDSSVDIDMNNVYYASDYSLATECHAFGGVNNLPIARLISNDQNWADNLNSESGVWNVARDSTPYIASLYKLLVQKSILNATNGRFMEGGALNPKRSLTGNKFEENFTYYLLDPTEFSGATNALNGILVFTEDVIKFGNAKDSVTNNFNVLIPNVSKHSAVSNLHVELYGQIQYKTNEDGTNQDYSGILVNENHGMIYNSSVNGNGITIAKINEGLGLIASSNAGMILNAFSTAEILSTLDIGGIAYSISGNGKIVSSYFTGYLEKGAGLVWSYTDASDDTYVYNCYMAGVVENKGNTSMFSQPNIKGSNNFIDEFANMDQKSSENSVWNLVSASEIIMNLEIDDGSWTDNRLLLGQWHTLNVDGKMSANTSNTHFGYNYGYPVAKMKDAIIDIGYQTYTGTGEYASDKLPKQSEITNFTSDTTNKVNARYTSLLVGKDDYKNAIKIPHLGVLSAVGKLIADNSTYGEDGKIKSAFDRNYIAIYDLDGSYGTANNTETFISWTAVNNFTGVFISNKNFAATTGSDSYCTISNLGTNGLFGNINNAYIGDFNLSGTFNNLNESNNEIIIGSGMLGTNVVGQTYIDNVSAEDVLINGTGNIGGLFGVVEGNIDIGANVSISAQISGSSGRAGAAGLIAGQVLAIDDNNAPTITFKEMNGDQKLHATITNATYAGGLVGQMTGGTINGNNRSLNIYTIAVDGTHNETFGGFVGLSGNESSGSTVTINGFKLTYVCGLNPIPTNTFGGYIGIANFATNFLNNTLNVEGDLVVASDSEKGFFGMIVGHNKAVVYLDKYELRVKEITFENKRACTENSTEQGAGLLIGYQESCGLIIDSKPEIKTNLTAKNISNLGGVAGYYKNGSIIINSNTTHELKLIGTMNVGGIFGQAEAIYGITFGGTLEVSKDDTTETRTGDSSVLSAKWADIELAGGEMNVGGIIGLLTGDIGEDPSDLNGDDDGGADGGVVSEVLTELTNNNPITIATVESGSATATNIGGIAGKFTGSYAGGTLINAAEIKLASGATTDGTADEDGKIRIKSVNAKKSNNSDKIETFVQTINVGGIFGSVGILATEDGKNVTYTSEPVKIDIQTGEGQANTIIVQGYQNVGGMVGFMYKTNIIGYADLKTLNVKQDGTIEAKDGAGADIELSALYQGTVTGVINVGGIAGYAKDSTISQMVSNADVVGNANVGGIVGATDGGVMMFNYLQGSGTDAVEVRGVYYNYMTTKNVNGSQTTETISYIPTNVGGLAGYMDGMAENNIVYMTNINSAKESDGKVISTISNFMLDSSKIPDNTIKSFTGSTRADDNDLIMFNEHIGGFGGFVGHLVSNSETGKEHTNNYMYGIDINASLGINVGTYYGYYGSELTNTSNLPTLYGEWDSTNNKTQDTLIDGAYNVGGLIGYVKNEVSGITNNAGGTATIMMQTRLGGFYVGTLFGKIETNSVSGLEINNTGNQKIYIDIVSSYYTGGLVGRMVMTENGSSFTGNVKSYIYQNETTTTSTITTGFNHGGLIGMLKIGYESSAGGQFTVNGTHNYPFTINTIENSNYTDGDANFDMKEEGTAYYLIAQAYYINMDRFIISGSAYVDGEGNTLFEKNPIRKAEEFSDGWHKEYTAFRYMQRCIPKNKNNGAGWDSVSIIYDAYNITKVESSLVKTGTEIKDGVQTDVYENKILYTIYEETPGVPTLYAPIGVASIYSVGASTKETISDGGLSKTLDGYASLYAKPQDQEPSSKALQYLAIYLGLENVDELGKSSYYVPLTDLTKFYPNETLTSISGQTTTNKGALKYYDGESATTVSLVYLVDGYLSDDRDNLIKAQEKEDGISFANADYSYESNDDKTKGTLSIKYKYTDENKQPKETTVDYLSTDCSTSAYFIFDIIYEDSETPGRTGSLFEVNGFVLDDESNKGKADEGEVSIEQEIADWIRKYGWIIDIIVALLSFGSSLYLTSAKKLVEKGITMTLRQRLRKAVGKAAGRALITFALMGATAGICAAGSQSQAIGSGYGRELYTASRSTSAGFLSQSYTKKVYGNGTANTQEHTIDFNSHSYIYYSSVRPDDYYTHMYLYVPLVDEKGEYVKDPVATGYKTKQEYDALKDNEEYFEMGDDDANGLMSKTEAIVKKYVYYQGVYYISEKGAVISEEKAHNFTPRENTEGTPLDIEGTHYIRKDSYTYVYGSMVDGEYVFSDGSQYYPNNAIIYKDGKYYTSHLEYPSWSRNEQELTDKIIVSTTGEDLKYEQKLVDTSIDGFKLKDTDIKGYTVILGGYYTANGRYKNVSGLKEMYAVYEKYGAVQPDGVEGIDWILVNVGTTETKEDADGNPITETIETPTYYKYNCKGLTSGTGNIYTNGMRIGEGTSIPNTDSINIRMYLDSLENIYSSSTTTIKDVYLYQQSETGNISHTPTYYLYEGEYVVDQDENIYILDATDYNPDDASDQLAFGNTSEYLIREIGPDEEGNYTYKVYKKQVTATRKTDGLLYDRYLQSSDGEHIFMKYLINAQEKLYTRFKYHVNTGDNGYPNLKDDLSGTWYTYNPITKVPVKIDKRLIGYNGRTTYFTESVKVCMGTANAGTAVFPYWSTNTDSGISIASGGFTIK
ncbi:MAG: hypothetical protein ACLRFL_00920 [Clostridia bacterium]